MSRARRLRRHQQRSAAHSSKTASKPNSPAVPKPLEPHIPHAPLLLAAAFLLPNLGALACGFVFDDRPLIVDNTSLHAHSLRDFFSVLHHTWTSGYWPDNRSVGLYRPVTETLWALLWAIGGGSHPVVFHATNLVLGLAVVLLLYKFFLTVAIPPRTAFIAAALFAVFPIHTDATTSVVGSAELLAAAFALSALLLYYRAYPLPALLLFTLAILSKESAAAFAALPLIFALAAPVNISTSPAPLSKRASRFAACAAAAIIAVALLLHHTFARGTHIAAIDNPTTLVSAPQRILTALWVQCLYLSKTLLPITLSADYSYKQIPLVMSLADWRALVGLLLVGTAAYAAIKRPEFRVPILAYVLLFSPTANILFPIGTILGERLAYSPTLAVALLLAILLARSRHWKIVLLAAALLFAVRTAVRNRDWLDSGRFYTRLADTSPDAAKSHYSIGVLLSSKGDDPGAIDAYNRAISIFPAYAEAYRNRGNAFARLGRRDEAMASYRVCLRFDPTDYAAAHNLLELQAGHSVSPPRAQL